MTPQTAPHPDPQAAAPDHALRADARRNRAAILRAAEEVFGAQGPDAPIDEVARRAGVGVGTLYRHFPTKEALLTALVTGHAEPLIEAAREALQADDPGPAFFALVRHLAGAFMSFRALADAIAAAGIDLHSIKGAASEELIDTVGKLLVRAQDAGAVRRDVTVTEVVTMMGALCQSESVARHPSSFSRCVDLVCDALRWNGGTTAA
ncbi:MAG: TetR/AcrR family transcriptional regulator [Candidatus Dormiibacterota bacterium]